MIEKCEMLLSWVLSTRLIKCINPRAKITVLYYFLLTFSKLADYEESIEIFLQTDSLVNINSQKNEMNASNGQKTYSRLNFFEPGINKNKLSLKFHSLKQKMNSNNLNQMVTNFCPNIFKNIGDLRYNGFKSFFGVSVFLFLQLSKPIYNLGETRIEEYKQSFKGNSNFVKYIL